MKRWRNKSGNEKVVSCYKAHTGQNVSFTVCFWVIEYRRVNYTKHFPGRVNIRFFIIKMGGQSCCVTNIKKMKNITLWKFTLTKSSIFHLDDAQQQRPEKYEA